MSAADAKKENMNPWQDKEALPRVRKPDAVLAFLAMALCSFALACIGDERIALIVLPVLFIYVVVRARTPGAVLLILACPVVGYFLAGGLFSGASAVLALIVGIAASAWLFSVIRPFYAAVAVIAAVFVLSWGITGNVYTSLLAFSFFPAGAALAYATVADKGRTGAIVWAQLGLVLTLATALIGILWLLYGAVNADVLGRAVADMRKNFVEVGVAYRNEMVALMEQTGNKDSAAVIESVREMWSDANLYTTATAFLYMLPGLLVAACGIVAFAAQLLLGMTYLRTGWKRVLTPDACIFTMSTTASVLFTVLSLISLFLNPLSTVGGAALNLYLILIPGFSVLGLGALSARMRRRSGGLFWILLFGAMICCSGVYAISFLALWGAVDQIMRAMARAAQNGKDNFEE